MVATLGANAPTGMPRCRSSRCFPNVAAWAELPRAQVSTKLGGCRLTRCSSSASGACNACGCRRTASGLVCHSASMLTRLSLTGSASIRQRGGARILPHHGAIAMRPRRRCRAASRYDGAWLRISADPAVPSFSVAHDIVQRRGATSTGAAVYAEQEASAAAFILRLLLRLLTRENQLGSTSVLLHVRIFATHGYRTREPALF